MRFDIDRAYYVQCRFQIKFYFPRKGGYLHCWVQIVYNSDNRMVSSEILLYCPIHITFGTLLRFKCSLTRVLWPRVKTGTHSFQMFGVKFHSRYTMNNVKYVRRNLIKRYLRKFVSLKRRVLNGMGRGSWAACA